MSTRLVVDKKSQLKEVSSSDRPLQPAAIRFLAKVISYVFHPLFIPVYLTFFLLQIHAYLFAGLDDWQKLAVFLQMFVNCTFLPLVSVLLLKGLKFINSIYLETQRDRIIPYVICMIFYFWNWYALKNNRQVSEIVDLSLAIFISSILGFLANINLKVSMHAIAVAVMSTFMALLTLHDSSNLILYFCLSVVITGAVCTSRLIVSSHHPREVYLGLLIGILSQLLAHWF